MLQSYFKSISSHGHLDLRLLIIKGPMFLTGSVKSKAAFANLIKT